MQVNVKTILAMQVLQELEAAHELLNRDELARRLNVHTDWIVSVTHALHRAGLIESVRGAGGGYRRKPAVTVGQVVEGVEGVLRPAPRDSKHMAEIRAALRGWIIEALAGKRLTDLPRRRK